MRRALTALALLLAAQPLAFGHVVDEYVQRAVVTLEPGEVQVAMRLVPGVEVADGLLKQIDQDNDGKLSDTEQRAYAQRVLGDVALQVDGDSIDLKLISYEFPSVEQMREGLGEIHLELKASVLSRAKKHDFVLENRHEPRIATYLANVAVTYGSHVRVTSQTRNQNQSTFRVTYTTD